ncbi:response regulator transcription factor [Candidatus Enterococcus leclercqii]|uniref:response regulator transcription factor n=1 Tax=Enterococcus TaxID=1350 RepID=UPI00137ABA3D|nr:response regulator [Enterococcus sp. CU9D]KAF1293555.1 DNA-binding response regulator [Enterococcus sp. CU9D]
MSNYTLLLVDDEEDVLRVITKKVAWEALGFRVIGTANNGVQALDIVEKEQPDVIMTDIKMPYMNGLELFQQVKADYPATKLLIFSGFDEFEYVKEALRLEVGDYILKPASSVELTEAFTQLKIKLDKEAAESRNIETLQQYYQESLPLMQVNFYATLLEGRVKEADLPRFLTSYQIPLKGPLYCCLVLHTSLSRLTTEMNPLLLTAAVQKQATDFFDDKWQGVYFSYLGETVMLAQLADEKAIPELTDECDRFCRYVLRKLNAVVTIGMGQVCTTILDLGNSYSSGRMAVSYRSIYGASRVLNINEVAPQEMQNVTLSNEGELGELLKKIHVGPKAAVEQAASVYLEHLNETTMSFSQHTVVISELIGALYRFSVNNNLTAEALTDNIKELYTRLPEMEPVSLRNWLLETTGMLYEQLKTARSHTTKSLVLKAQEYVRSHYNDETLSLDDICHFLGVSNSYFSSMFKKETGTTFIGYLTDYRLDHASRMLLETAEKSYIIGQKVGYTDPNYFSYVFKRRFGLSPLNYRTGNVERVGKV